MKMKFILAAVLLSGTTYAQQNVSTNGVKYVLLEEGTGAWCPHCSDGAVYVENVLASHPKVIAASIHDDQGAGPTLDQMVIAEGATWNTDYATPVGWPCGAVDRLTNIAGNTDVVMNRGKWASACTSREGASADVDINMTHYYDQTTKTLSITVTAKMKKDLSGEYRINAYVVEDKVSGTGSGWDQKNDTSYYNNNPSHKYYKANNNATKTAIVGFKHMQVVRAMLGGTYGTAGIIANNPKKDATYTKTYTYTVTGTQKVSDMKLIGMVQQYNADLKKRPILNSVQAKVLPWNPSGIAQVSNFTEMKVFPNPASSVIGIQALVNEPAETKVTITNAVGQTVFTKMYPAGGSMFAESISVEHLNSGLYFVTVSSNGSSVVEKLFINK